jgi:hypothetical protein
MPDQYWRTDGSLNAAHPGIRLLVAQDIEITSDDPSARPTILRAPQNFQAYTASCLDLLYRTAAGQTVLNALVTGTCSIGFSLGNSAGVGNARASMKPAMYEILHDGRPGAAARNAMDAGFAARLSQESDRRLAEAVNAQPRWKLDQPPGSDGGLWAYAQSWRDYGNSWLRWSSDPGESYFDNQLWTSRWGSSGAGLAITPMEMRAWMRNGTLPGRLSDDNKRQLKLATAVALYPHAQAGTGSPSAVRFAVGPHDAFRHQRPPAIALGHELVHAYFSQLGDQPGEEVSHFSTALFEFRCVGLGPWNNDAVSENALRAQWGAVVQHVPLADADNRLVPGKRIRY